MKNKETLGIRISVYSCCHPIGTGRDCKERVQRMLNVSELLVVCLSPLHVRELGIGKQTSNKVTRERTKGWQYWGKSFPLFVIGSALCSCSHSRNLRSRVLLRQELVRVMESESDRDSGGRFRRVEMGDLEI